MDVFVGIDPSMNSTGVCALYIDNNTVVKEHFYIIKPNKLSKKEQKAAEEILFFDYILYEKRNLDIYKDNNHWHEYYKTLNMSDVASAVYNIITDPSITKVSDNIHIVMEGISYGSTIRTKSVFDLAGLNYMIRQKIINNFDLYFTIATPSEIKKFASGNGNCKKEVIIDLFKISHPDFDLPKLDDVADAYYMAKYAYKLYNEEKNIST